MLRLSEKEAKKLNLQKSQTSSPKTGRTVNKKRAVNKKSALSIGEETLALQIKASGLANPIRQYKFDPQRKWRADFAWPEQKLLVEIHGGIFSNGRHVRGLGFQQDLEKSQAAFLSGYKLVSFSTEDVTSGKAIGIILTTLNSTLPHTKME